MAKKEDSQKNEGIVIENEKTSDDPLEKIVLQTMSSNEDVVMPKKSKLDKKVFLNITKNIAETHGLAQRTACKAIFLLFLAGAANRGTPNSLSVIVKDITGTDATINKGDLLYFYNRETQNNYLRRLAESVADEISRFAEFHGISGDLANQIDRTIKTSITEEGKTPVKLNSKERAWCSSFNQDNPTLENDKTLNRVSILLAQDLERKFNQKRNPKPKSIQKPEKPKKKKGK